MRVEEQVLAFFEARIEEIKREIRERDQPAIDAYHETQKDIHNLYTGTWSELTEEQREAWRFKVGIKPPPERKTETPSAVASPDPSPRTDQRVDIQPRRKPDGGPLPSP